MDSAIPTPAKATMSGLCFVLCASHSTKNALFCNIVRKGGCASTFKRLPVRTALMSSSALAECLVSESARQSSLRTCARSCICPLLLSFLSHCLFLFRLMCCGCCGDKIIRISADVYICDFACCLTRDREEMNRSNASVRAILQQLWTWLFR